MRAFTHPSFKDVYFLVKKSFFVAEKNIWKLKIIWMRRKYGYAISEDKLIVSAEKYKEFRLYKGDS